MSDEPPSFARAAAGVRAATALHDGEFLQVYTGRLQSGPGTVRFVVLSPAVSDPAVAAAFERVAADWEAISSHRGVVTVHDRGETPRPWIAVESVDGQRLSEHDTPLPVDEARSVAGVVAEALREAGRAGVHHGSLDPDAVWLTGDGGVRVGGWGLERACRVAAGGWPATPYTAPELAAGEATPDDRTDVYGLGAVTYYALTGQPPDGSDARASALNPDVPGEFDAVLAAALARDPRERHATPYEFKLATLFDSHGQGRPTEADTGESGDGAPRSGGGGPTAEAAKRARTDADDAGHDSDEAGGRAVGSYPLTRRAALGTLGLGIVGAAGWVAADQLVGSDSPDGVPMFQYDVGNTGYAPDDRGPQSDAEVAWTTESPQRVLQPIIAGETVFLGGVDRLLAIDATDGSERWSVEREGFWSLPAVADGQAHFIRTQRPGGGNVTATVHAFDVGDGAERWESESVTGGAPQPLIPTVTSGTVYFSTPAGIHGVDVADGAKAVRLGDWPDPGLFQAFDDDRLYFTSREGLFALDRGGWTEAWSLPDGYGWGLTVVDGSVYLPRSSGGGDGPAIQAVSASTGEPRWTVTLEERTLGPIAAAEGTLFAGTRDGVLHALDTADGSTAWTRELGQGTGPPAIVAGDTVYASTLEGELFALDVADGSQRWTVSIEDVSGLPAVAGGRLFVSGARKLYAVAEP